MRSQVARSPADYRKAVIHLTLFVFVALLNPKGPFQSQRSR